MESQKNEETKEENSIDIDPETLKRGLEQARRAGDRANTCSYSQGYVNQLVYTCLTCNTNGEPAGICLGCSMNCHLDHNVTELFYKRDFRCDCGNAKFPDFSCTLQSDKDVRNPENRYNQNFYGTYCSCKQPYAEGEEVMYQCVMCQDWFHDRCVSSPPPSEESEFVCRRCVAFSDFEYIRVYWKQLPSVSSEEKSSASTASSPSSTQPVTAEGTEGESSEHIPCRRPQTGPPVPDGKDWYLPDNWRVSVCHCPACEAEYKRQQLTSYVTAVYTADDLLLPDDEEEEEDEVDEGKEDEGDNPASEEHSGDVPSTPARPSSSSTTTTTTTTPSTAGSAASTAVSSSPPVISIDSSSFVSRAMAGFAQNLRVDQQASVRSFFEQTQQELMDYMQSHPGAVITGDIMREIVARVQARLTGEDDGSPSLIGKKRHFDEMS